MKNIPLFRWKRRYLHFIDILVVKDASYRRSRVSRNWPILAQWCEILFLLELLLELRPVNFHKSLPHTRFGLEARVGIEPTNEAFAEPCLTTWLPRRKALNVNSIPTRGKFNRQALLTQVVSR